MATTTTTTRTDDIDGGEGASPVTFALDGTTYEIDLTEANAAKLRDALALYVGHARKAPSGPARRSGSGSSGTGSSGTGSSGAASSGGSGLGYDAKAVRAWAAENGTPLPPRGRIPGAVVEQYRAATGG